MSRPLRVLLVTSWNTPCGIADYAAALKESVEAADSGIEIVPSAEALDPNQVGALLGAFDLVHLNHHDALHARWTPKHVDALTRNGLPVVVTYHDTTADPSPSSKIAQLALVASSLIVHEPLAAYADGVWAGVKAVYWPQGIPAAAQAPVDYALNSDGRYTTTDSTPPPKYAQYLRQPGYARYLTPIWKHFPQQPVLGTVGFNFPWKNYDRLCQLTADEGWALVLLSANATADDEARWRSLNSAILVVREFLPQSVAINYLAGCDATVFAYECANTGTSGAIRQGIAARKPVIAFSTCRQFRDLLEDQDLGNGAIDWVDGWEGLRYALWRTPVERVNPRIYALAHRDSWTIRGREHAQLYRLLTEPGVAGSTI